MSNFKAHNDIVNV